jgi:hypothetical protein
MTEQEKEEILSELEARIEKKYKGCLSREDTQTILKKPREKWFNSSGESRKESPMAQAFNSTIISWQVWETIRKLTCVVCGKQYVRHLSGIEYADEVAEKICQFIYDLKSQYGNESDGEL